ncbi:MAG: TIGR04552 family protein, partial [Myxococcales bacterium]|nr:TIGR04552 family protein [Myxococcales bacterium]
PADVRQVFLWASQWGGFRRTQILSCVVLKLMHIIHHMESADLKFRLPLAEEHLLRVAHRRILQQARNLQEDGVPIVAFYGNRKSRSSIITKLLAKREAVAATIFDKLRYRVVVERHEDLGPTLARMAQTMFPFNYVVPGQSNSNLLTMSQLYPMLSEEDRARARERGHLTDVEELGPKNEFSGASYRVINWIADYPVQVPTAPQGFGFECGRVVYVNVEFQLLDQDTARHNEQGENAHALYKARQYRRVAGRLKRGGASRRD